MLEVAWRFEPITFYIGELRVKLILACGAKMDAHKHHSLVYTQYTHTTMLTQQYYTSHSTHQAITHLGKLPQYVYQVTPSNIFTTLPPNKAIPLTYMLPHNANPYKTSLKLPPKAPSKIQGCSMRVDSAIATHTPQNHKHQGKHNHLHLPPNIHPRYASPKIWMHNIYKLTF